MSTTVPSESDRQPAHEADTQTLAPMANSACRGAGVAESMMDSVSEFLSRGSTYFGFPAGAGQGLNPRYFSGMQVTLGPRTSSLLTTGRVASTAFFTDTIAMSRS